MPSPPYNISSKSINRIKSCTHLRSLIVRHFEMVQGTGLNSVVHSPRNIQWYYPIQNFIQIHQSVQKLHTRLKVCHFRMVESTRFNSMQPMSSSSSSLAYKVSSKPTNRFKRCTHLRSLNVRQFGMIEATGLNNM
jgi:hypothetical protein